MNAFQPAFDIRKDATMVVQQIPHRMENNLAAMSGLLQLPGFKLDDTFRFIVLVICLML